MVCCLVAVAQIYVVAEPTAKKPANEKTAVEQKTVGKPNIKFYGGAEGFVSFVSPKYTYSKKDMDDTNVGAIAANDIEKVTKTDKDTSTPRAVGGEAAIGVKVNGTASHGIEYGAVIELDAMKGDTGVDKMYVLVGRKNAGVLQIGNVKGPEAVFLCGGQQLIGGTLGVDGTVPSDVDAATGVISPLHVVGYTNKATKIVYYSPRVWGLQAGVAFTPSTSHVGHDKRDRSSGTSKLGNDEGLYAPKKDAQRPSGRTSLSFGLNHKHEWTKKIRTEFAAVYLCENTRKITLKYADADHSITLRKAKAYHVTVTVFYGDLGIGFGYLNNGKSRLPKNYSEFNTTTVNGAQHGNGGFIAEEGANAGSAWNIGVQYKYNDWTFAAVFHKSQRKVNASQKTKGNMLTLTADYKVCEGLGLFAEFDYIQTKSCEKACALRNAFANDGVAVAGDRKAVAIEKQKCPVYAVGVKVSF
ncbi:MAG: porin [Holosporales bacterium]|nr:porin [Holosporales bacterium]